MQRDLNRDWALRLAEAGVAVFPCGADKKPLVKWSVFSSSDPDAIVAWWQQFPNALPAIDLAKTGLFVLDGDRHGGPDGRAALRGLLRQQGFNGRATPTVLTPGDGVHVYFLQNDHELSNARGDLPDGVDCRGYGGYTVCPYAILPDGRSYRASPNTPDFIAASSSNTIAQVPQGIVDLIRARNAKREQTQGKTSSNGAGVREQAYAEAALNGCAAELAAAASGGRNQKLNALAFRMGRMTVRGWIDRSIVEAALTEAMHANSYVAEDGIKAVEATLKSGLDAGENDPHPDLSEREGSSSTGQQQGQQHDEQQRQGPSSPIIFLRASDVDQKLVDWLWPGRLAAGKQTLVAGDPGVGKSHIGYDIGARITRGIAWPDGHVPGVGNFVILSAEDAANDTICPRLEAAGADLSKVYLLQAVVEQNGLRRCFSLQRDLEALGNAVAAIGDVSAIMIDPLTAYMGDIDSHRTTDVRSTLEPFDRFADTYRTAIFAVTHPPKASSGRAIHNFTGSLAFVAAARLAFVAIEETETGRSLLLPVKNNLGHEGGRHWLSYRADNHRQRYPDLAHCLGPVAGADDRQRGGAGGRRRGPQ